jgi:hypothetical protein
MYAMYRPLRVFSRIGMIVAFIGVIPMVRFLYDYLFVSGQGKIQSLVIGSALLTIGVLTFLLGLIADLTNHNRALIEQVLIKVRMLEAAQSHRLGPGEQQTEPKELRYGRNRKSAQQRADIKQARELIEQQEEHIL